jgi:predicted nucleotidyltransferase
MVSKEILDDVKNRLVKAYNPIAIYLFGSYAWGTPSEESDLDLLIVVDKSEEKSFRRPIKGYDALRGLEYIPKDLIVQTKDEFERRSSEKTTLEYKIKKSGECIYARA